jgi:integrase
MAKGSMRWRGNSLEVCIPIPGGRTTGGYQDYRRESRCLRPGETRAEIEAWGNAKLDEWRLELYRGEFLVPTRMTTAQYLDYWLANSPDIKPGKSRAWYEMIVRVHLIPFLGHIPLAKLTTLDIQSYLTHALAAGRKWRKKPGPLSPNTVRGHYKIIRAALNDAVSWKLIRENPALGAKPPAAVEREYIVLDYEKAADLLQHTLFLRRRDRLIVMTALYTGLRIGEVLGLRVEDFDGAVNVHQNVQRPGRHPEFGPPKSVKSRRRIPLPQELADEIQLHIEEEKARKKPKGYFDHGLLFPTRYGTPIDDRNFSQRTWKELLAAAGLPAGMRFHELRHTFGTWLGEEADPKTGQLAMGHADVHTFLTTYVHPAEAQLGAALGVIAENLKKHEKGQAH